MLWCGGGPEPRLCGVGLDECCFDWGVFGGQLLRPVTVAAANVRCKDRGMYGRMSEDCGCGCCCGCCFVVLGLAVRCGGGGVVGSWSLGHVPADDLIHCNTEREQTQHRHGLNIV